jgi:hypothetical protein
MHFSESLPTEYFITPKKMHPNPLMGLVPHPRSSCLEYLSFLPPNIDPTARCYHVTIEYAIRTLRIRWRLPIGGSAMCRRSRDDSETVMANHKAVAG